MRTVAFHTLGCKLNFSETSTLARQFQRAGWSRVEFPGTAQVYVVNTCSVTENADRECRTIVNRALQANPEARIIIVGCYAQLKPQEIAAIPGVNLVLGATEKFNVLNYLEGLSASEGAQVMACDIEAVNQFVPSWSSGDRTRTFLKVQDGCDYTCSFCTIPLARGKSRSTTVAEVLNQVEQLSLQGVQEVVLTGVNLGDFGLSGADSGRMESFTQLVQALDQQAAIPRIRISSIEPNLLTDEIIHTVSDSKVFMPHFHIPLQSGDNEMLGRMRRRYRRELYGDRVRRIKSLMPHAAIGVDVIVGFPGESDRHFRETFDFLHDLPVSYLHVFTYSERANTAAVEMQDVVSVSVRKERNRMLRNLSAKKMHDFTVSQIGCRDEVLFEEENQQGRIQGYTKNYIRVVHPYDATLVNKVVTCHLADIGHSGLVEVQIVPDDKAGLTLAS